MKFHINFLLAVIAVFGSVLTVSAQVDSVIGQITNAPVESFAGGISGDGRFVVFESTSNIATENPRNADGNREIFLFDYAQRRIFQITNTTSLRSDTTGAFVNANIKVAITNTRPVISNDGRWIAFGSNATIAFPGNPTAVPPVPPIVSTTNPGNFNAESFNPVAPSTTPNPLLADANTEMWLYQIPAAAPVADLSFGGEIAVTDLSAGTFTQVTNTLPSRLPVAGTAIAPPVIGDDQRDASISDDGSYIAFVSNRNLVPAVGNVAPDANDEIFSYIRNATTLTQITKTPRGTIVDPIYNQTPTISGNGLRIAFGSNADNPIVGMTGGTNTDRNIEVFYADMAANGALTAATAANQITKTARANPGDLINVIDFGRRMSRDGRYIAFDSYADLAAENGGNNYTSFALYLYDTQPPVTNPPTPAFRRIGPRSDADAAAIGGDVAHYPGFTDTGANGAPATLVLETRANILANGTIAATASAGLNPNAARPAQIYSYSLTDAPAAATFKRLTTLPASSIVTASTQPLTSNSVQRMTFNLALTEIGTGNFDLSSETYYFLLPTVTAQTPASLNFATGASRQAVSASPVPTPTATATPTPSPTATPTGSPTATPTPTPQTPTAVQGISPGMLAALDFDTGISSPVVAQTAVGSLARSFTLPIELSGVTMTINGAAVGLRFVSQRQIVFVVPSGLASTVAGTSYPVVVNNNGVVFRGSVTIVPTRPDIFTFAAAPGASGRARIFNVTNTVPRTEPFNVTTLRYKGGRRVPSVMRLFLTGIENVPASLVTVRIGNRTFTGTLNSVTREPGVQTVDFTLPAELLGAGDVPIIVSITVGGVTFQSRLDDTAARLRIL